MPNIRKICRITGDLSGLSRSLKERRTADGQNYYQARLSTCLQRTGSETDIQFRQINYSIEISFGSTALCAELHWEENGVQKKVRLL